jgi:hypothetical protein
MSPNDDLSVSTFEVWCVVRDRVIQAISVDRSQAPTPCLVLSITCRDLTRTVMSLKSCHFLLFPTQALLDIIDRIHNKACILHALFIH